MAFSIYAAMDRLIARRDAIKPLLDGLTKTRQAHSEVLRTIDDDTSRTPKWKAEAKAEAIDLWVRTVRPNLTKPIDQEIEGFEREYARLNNPTMQLAPFHALGAESVVDDAAVKAEFRALMQTLPVSARREWFVKLAEDKNLGLLGVLVALEPSLQEDALALDIPGRDHALKVAAEIRSSVKEYRNQERLDRMQAIQKIPNPTQEQALEILVIADEMNKEQRATQNLIANTFSEDERTRYQELRQKAETGQLSKGESITYLALCDKVARMALAESETKNPSKPLPAADVDRTRARFQELLSKPSLTSSEKQEVVVLGAKVKEANDAAKGL